jgi:hypothetical protein
MAHGDLRLDNVYLVRGTPEPRVKVAWTSAAKAERAAKEDVARDIASLGVMLRLLVTGHTDADADGASTLPSDLSHAVARALAQDRTGKFNNVGELARALAPFAPPGHGAARAVAYLLSRAGIVGGPVPGAPRAMRSASSSPAVSSPGARTAKATDVAASTAGSVTDRLSFTDEWFGRPTRSSILPPPEPQRSGRGFAFAVVSVALVSAALGGSVFLWESGRLPRWTGAAPPESVGTTELTSSTDESANESERERAAAEAQAQAAADEANASAQAEQQANERGARAPEPAKSVSVESLPNVPPATTTRAAPVSAPPAHEAITNAVPEIRGVTPPSPTSTTAASAASASTTSPATTGAPTSSAASESNGMDRASAPPASATSDPTTAPSATAPATTNDPASPPPAPSPSTAPSPSESETPPSPSPTQPDPTSPPQ